MNTFEKYHALGNDYLVYDPKTGSGEFSEEDVIRICHRNFGLGSDGILVGPLPSEKADFGLRILNPDGSEAEKSGNGLRIFCRYLWDQHLVASNASFRVITKGGVVEATVHHDGQEVTISMGKVSFASNLIPVEGDSREVLQEKKDAKSEVDLLELINWTVNRTVVYRSDWDHWHRRDYWEPLATTIKEGGDCEDFALAKAAALHIDGWPASKLRILIGYVTVRGQKVAHAVLLATTKSNREYVLDNRSKWVLSLNDFERGFQPLYSIDETGAHAEFFRTTPQPH